MLAVRLLRCQPARPFDVLLINRPPMVPAGGGAVPPRVAGNGSSLARGLAYGTNSEDHLLNVPAGRMSAFDEAPHDFENYLQRQKPAQDGVVGGEKAAKPSVSGAFVARKWYGSYLQSTLRDAVVAASLRADGPQLTTRFANVTGLSHVDDGRLQLRIEMPGGKPGEEHVVTADRVVLALGNFPPTNPRIDDPRFYESSAYLRDPWREGALAEINLDLPVLLIGTGLTMFDVAMSLKRRADHAGKRLQIVAISRRGLLPQPHRSAVESTVFPDVPANIAGTASVRRLLGQIRRHVAEVERAGGDWRDVLASLRPLTPTIWHQFSSAERRRFLRHLRPYWESHRHRAAPDAAAAIARLLASRQLAVQAAQLVRLQPGSAGVVATIRPRGATSESELVVGGVVNCTGPSSALYAEPLLAELVRQGMISADDLSLGVQVADDYRVLDTSGMPARSLFYVGPLLKAKHWEATAVPELRTHVAAAAASVIASLPA